MRHGGYDSIDADSYDVETHILVDDGYRSDDESSDLLNESTP